MKQSCVFDSVTVKILYKTNVAVGYENPEKRMSGWNLDCNANLKLVGLPSTDYL